MKKRLIILLILVFGIILFFIFQNYSFKTYITKKYMNEMNIPVNSKAPVKSGNSIEIDAPIDIVWKVLTEIEKWTEWQKSVTEVKLSEEIEEGKQFNWKAGGLSFKSRIHTMKPKIMFGWTGTTIGASAIHNWKFEEFNGKTKVSVEESLQGVFPILFRKYFQKNLDSGIKMNLEELKIAAEKESIK